MTAGGIVAGRLAYVPLAGIAECETPGRQQVALYSGQPLTARLKRLSAPLVSVRPVCDGNTLPQPLSSG